MPLSWTVWGTAPTLMSYVGGWEAVAQILGCIKVALRCELVANSWTKYEFCVYLRV